MVGLQEDKSIHNFTMPSLVRSKYFCVPFFQCCENCSLPKNHSPYYIKLTPTLKFAKCACCTFQFGFLTSQLVLIDTYLNPQAVALQCRFLRLAAPVGLTSSGVLSQLLRIREDLVAKKVHEPIKAHVFMSASFNQEEHRTPSNQS